MSIGDEVWRIGMDVWDRAAKGQVSATRAKEICIEAQEGVRRAGGTPEDQEAACRELNAIIAEHNKTAAAENTLAAWIEKLWAPIAIAVVVVVAIGVLRK